MKRLHFFAIPFLCTIAFLVGCKKDDISENNQNVSAFNLRTPVDDPDVEVQNVDLSINTNINEYYFDTTINISELNIKLGYYLYRDIVDNSYKSINVTFDYMSSCSFQSDIPVFVEETSASSRSYFLPTFFTGVKIETGKSVWNGTNFYGLIYSKSDGQTYGINGKNDRYIAFRKKVGTDYFYGWIKLNLSADANTFIIKSVAFCDVPNKAIYFGDY